MIDRFRRHIEASGLIAPGARVLVGYSGGGDSACLLHLMASLGFDVVAGHLHHGLRAEADRELKLAEAFCQDLNLPFASGRADVPRMMRELRIGEEEAGRKARYQFFAQAAFETGCALIATAHTRDDQVETVLMRVARGTGISGLAGIPERRQNIIRPLLPFSRAETRAYCAENGLWTHDDPSNENLAFARARIRLRVLPELRAIHPATDEAIVRLAALAGEEDRFLDGAAAAALERAESALNGDLSFLTRDVEVAFDRGALLHLPRVLLRRAIRLASGALGASVDHHAVERLIDALATEPRGSHTAEGGEIVIEWSDRLVHFRELKPAVPFRYPLTLPGETISDEFGWRFIAREGIPGVPIRASLETWIDLAKTRGPLYFRTAQAGDSMRPFGFDGSRKVSDLLSEAKLTQACRARLPIVCDLIGPLWIPGVCLDARAAASANSDRVLCVQFSKADDVWDPIQGNFQDSGGVPNV